MPTPLEVRRFVVDRLHEDLVGPVGGPNEVLDGRPSDRYLTGILFPQNAFLGADEDEKLQTDDDEESSTASDQVALWRTRRPASAGVSFAVRAHPGGVPAVLVAVSCGVYRPHEPASGVVGDDKAGRQSRPKFWKRTPLQSEILVNLTSGVAAPFRPFELFPELEVHVRTAAERDAVTVTVALVNGAEEQESLGRDAAEQKTVFQAGLTVSAHTGCDLVPRPSRSAGVGEEDARITRLIYREQHEWAAGHTCAAEWDARGTVIRSVRTAWLPEQVVWSVSPEGAPEFDALRGDPALRPLSATWLAESDRASLERGLRLLPAAYRTWIKRESERARTLGLGPGEQRQAEEHFAQCERAAARMSEAVQRLAADTAEGKRLRRAFQLANRALVMQRIWQNTIAGESSRDLVWRPFQLGFQLLALASTTDPAHPDRRVMDLLWFPTGGGKTEAYLGLTACLLFYRRLRQDGDADGLGTAVIMRYTLRTLTIQQFERASALICACELLRRGLPELGSSPFSIGLWVGSDATPNTLKAAKEKVDGDTSDYKQLVKCPACGEGLSWALEPPARPTTASCRCRNPKCELSRGDQPLPVWTIDELIYRERPSLLIGTVDKFAQIVRNENTRAFFGAGRSRPPELVIQDELHLISGPLGTMTGLYETAVDALCEFQGVVPKVVGSTATIRRASDQVRALFDRSTFQFPPPGIDASDSGFARRATEQEVPGRLYLGVTSAGRSMKFTLQAAAASLFQAVLAARTRQGATDADLDPYWTLVCYFNTLAELGGAMIVLQDDVPLSMQEYARRRSNHPPIEVVRTIAEPEEMTSRIGSSDIRDRLQQLKVRAGTEGCIDAIMATNMLSVGVDIPRLGLMLVNGQPKSMAEYIQATSRVGRKEPGLVVTLYNHNRARDRSHFETFATWHTALYREVEAGSVTPFASRARDRALHAALVALIRHRYTPMFNDPRLTAQRRVECNRLAEVLVRRAESVDPRERDAVRAELGRLLDDWEGRTRLTEYWPNRPSESGLLMGAEEAAAQMAAHGETVDAWATPNSMRTVEPGTCLRLREFVDREGDAPAAGN